jgi:hypothetical protein
MHVAGEAAAAKDPILAVDGVVDAVDDSADLFRFG